MSIILDALKKAEDKPKDPPATDNKNEKKAERLDSGTPKTFSGNTAATATLTAKEQATQKIVGAIEKTKNQMAGNRRTILLAIGAVTSVLVFVIFSSADYRDALFSSEGGGVSLTPRAKPKVAQKAAKEDSQKNKEKAREAQVIAMKRSAELYYNNGQFEKSLKEYRELSNIAPSDPEVYNNYGVTLKKMGRYRDALVAYETALALNPDYPEALNNIAVVNMVDGYYNEAKKHLEKAIRVRPDYIDPYLHLALCLEKIGDLETAMDYYYQFLQVSSDTKIDRKIRIQVESRIAKIKEDL